MSFFHGTGRLNSTKKLLSRGVHRRETIKAEEDKFRAKGKRPANTKWQARYKAALPIGEEVQPYEVPETWRWAVAEEIVAPGAEIVYGIVQPGPQLDDGIPYVRGLDIVDGVIQTSQLLKTSPEIAEKYSRATLQGGDVLLGIIRATKVAIVPGEIAGANITQGTARFRPSDAIMTAFLVVRS
jgi:type I restriction enzyme S subunit